jgi:uncharacterized protein (TIGR02284 family)
MYAPKHEAFTMELPSKEIISVLNRLIEINTDAEKGYAAAAADARAPELKDALADRSRECSYRVIALQDAVQRYGVLPENEGTAKGALHRGWMQTRRIVEGPDDRIVLEECARGEAAAVKAYGSVPPALSKLMPPDVATLLADQSLGFRNAYEDTLRRLARAKTGG